MHYPIPSLLGGRDKVKLSSQKNGMKLWFVQIMKMKIMILLYIHNDINNNNNNTNTGGMNQFISFDL